ncbi:MAG: hypothetical protein H6622_14515 [Halobacteriovoraceae bacterium]|nr:hypothetical protein [Halobacteriovoraceae bacterium]
MLLKAVKVALIYLLPYTLLFSCSMISRKGKDEPKKEESKSTQVGSNQSAEVVSNTENEPSDVRSKYLALLKKYKDVNPNDPEIKNFEMEMDSSVSNQQNIMSDLNEAKGPAQLIETVDVFPTVEKKAMDLSTSNSGILRELVEDETVESHVRNILKAEELVGEAKYNEALILLREMEASPLIQIKVRAKFLLGEILFQQKEYDLSMQIYEEIVMKYAFSSVIFKVLGRLVVCSEKLNLASKQQKYYSILHDLFGYDKQEG